MESVEIKKLSEKNFVLEKNLNEIKKNYLISYGKYDEYELKKALDNKKPFYLKNKFIIGYKNNKFISDKDEEIKIERMVKAVIIEDLITEPEKMKDEDDYFAIVNKNQWDDPISEFQSIIGDLRVGEIFLPPHSAVFNFIRPTEREIKEKIVSSIEGININIYSKDNYIDNSIHEIGHLFWRDCLSYDEKQLFNKHFNHLKPSAIYEYEWEKSNEEEVFCTIYKWFLKSILLNPSFYNILEYEEPEGLKLFQNVLDRISKDKLISDIWDLNKENIYKYINPKGRVIVKEGTFDQIRDTELPDNLLNDVNKFQDGIMFINLNKACVPVINNKIDWEEMEKAKYIRKEPDGKGGFKYIYKEKNKKENKKEKNKINQIKTKEFKEWFGNSKVVDKNGIPKIQYHGTDRKLTIIESGYDEPGAWFTSDKKNASNYAKGLDAQIYNVYLKAEKPLNVPFEWNGEEMVPEIKGLDENDMEELRLDNNVSIVKYAKSKGYDSVNFPNGNFSESGETWVVFDSSQIKSATDNKGTFDPKSSDMTKAKSNKGN